MLIAVGGIATTVIGQQQRYEHAWQAGQLTLTRIEQLLTSAQRTGIQVAGLVGQPCQRVLPALRNAATQAAFVYTLKLVQQQRVYCSSLRADVNEPIPSAFAHNDTTRSLILQPGNASRPYYPLLSILTATSEGAVISTIDSAHLATLLSLNLPTTLIWLQVGEFWLDSSGQLHDESPPQAQDAQIYHASATYPLGLSLYYTTSFTTWLGWANQWRLTWLLWLAFSLSCAIALWRWLGQTSPLEAALEQGVERKEFIPYVQPVICAHNRQLCGLEVLMRWQRQHVGLVEPMQFIPQAEASGLIVPMTRQMMTQVVAQLAPMASRLPTPFHLAVNISAAHFRSNTLLSDCREFLSYFPSGKVQLTLELTEREWLCNNPQTLTLLHELRSMGIYLALDDFGTGHSSLAYLKQFPVDIIKLDQMFVRKIGVEDVSQHVVNHVIDLGHKLGLDIVAEGVENEFQADYLTRRGVDQLQGYLFGKPQPLQEWLTELWPLVSKHYPWCRPGQGDLATVGGDEQFQPPA
ncbi:EAL domain-containing protein [Aeromonas sp. MdU4]|uniref:EAL domain-containing protein n=1 Tax=Aeromonas sp. MdU4 TaxID=3342819 RepID=UPI0035BACD05